jgi:putative tricarboxylic transport membrane protein
MAEAVLTALATILSGAHLGWLGLGVVLGVVVGILPGLGGTAGMSLLLPFIFGMDPTSALTLMIGLLAVVATGDTFTSILMGIPGSAGSQATVLDGFPMAKRGEAARALGAAFFASLIGGLFGAVVLTLVVQAARPIVLAFGSAELLMLAIFGLSMVGVLSGQSLPKGIAACGLGLLLGAVGPAPATGHFRMTFGSSYLTDGLPITVVALGIFALPEIADLLKSGGSIARRSVFGSGQFAGVIDVIRHRWIVLRSSIIGCIVGAIPGLGGSVVDWIAYGHVVQAAKDKSGFGKGDIRGVIAPESANNAKEGGALIPTLVFGIPGSGGTAVLLGGLLLIGIVPGPRMIQSQLDLVFVIIWSLALANVLGALMCFTVSGMLAKLTEIRYAYLAPFMLAIILFGAYQATRNWGDLLTLVALGAFATLMKRYGWPRPPLLIGFVLAGGIEVYLYQAVQFYGLGWLGRPIVLVILALTVVSVWLGLRHRVQTEAQDMLEPGSRGASLVFALVVGALGALALLDTADIPFLSRVFPWSVALVTMLAAAAATLAVFRTSPEQFPRFDPEAVLRSPELRFLGWLAALLLGTWLVGFLPAVALFSTAFLMIEARARLLPACLMAAFAIAGLYLLARLLVIGYPGGLITAALLSS